MDRGWRQRWRHGGPLLSRLRRLALAGRLAREAGWRHVRRFALLTGLSSLLDMVSLGVGASLLLGGGGPSLAWRLPFRLDLPRGLALLVGMVLLRGALQAWTAIGQERLRAGFADRLRQQLLSQVVHAPAERLEQLGRGALLGLLMADINRSVFALDQGLRVLQGLLSLLLYGVGVLLAGRETALPLVLALAATGAAALAQRSGSWQLGRLQTRLNGALQRTVGDGLHGLKAVRAAAAEAWLLRRFAHDTALFRQVMRQTVRRQALFAALRDTLVVGVVGAWLVWGRAELAPAAIATTLLLAYRSGTSLSAVIGAQRFCLGALPGYEELCRRRAILTPPAPEPRTGAPPRPAVAPAALERPSAWRSLRWQAEEGAERTTPEATTALTLRPGALVAVVGPSGSGKTTLLDRFCGLLGEERSQWWIEADGAQLTLGGAEGARQLRQWLAYAPQEAVLFEASLRHNLLLDQRQPEAVIAGWLDRLELTHLRQRPGGIDEPLPLALAHFSGGEIHRLGLLRAWLRDRPVEVLDEPTAFLDAVAAERVRSILLERSRERLVLVSTHDTELMRQADRVVRLEAGDRVRAERQHHGGAAR
ncbi:MAG: ATP-binding cassette domain-containing protein [Cyanobacteriota bacterium]|nr:ATP-binding cassette domain-containing protein [Cyanobacteriota bacterium]